MRSRQLKKGNTKSRSKDQIRVIQNIENIFDLREKNIDLFRNHSSLLSEAEY